MRARSLLSSCADGPPAAWTVPPAARAEVTPAVAARTARLDGRAVLPVLPVLLSGTCAPLEGDPRRAGDPLKGILEGNCREVTNIREVSAGQGSAQQPGRGRHRRNGRGARR